MGKGGLHTLAGMLKKASGRCYEHQPDGHGAFYTLLWFIYILLKSISDYLRNRLTFFCRLFGCLFPER